MRRIKKAKIRFLSLCPKGANQIAPIYKADGTFSLQMLTKAASGFDEQGELFAAVYLPEQRDSQGDIASADVIKAMMYDAAKDGIEIDLQHDGKALTKDQAFVAEQFIIQKSDPRFEGMTDYDGNAVDPTGGWGVVLKIEDPDLRKLYRDGKWSGISMGGEAQVEVEKTSDPKKLLQKLAEALGLRWSYAHQTVTLSGDVDMNKEELQEMLEKNNKTLAEAIAKAIQPAALAAPATPPAPPAAPAAETVTAPVFKGDPTKAEDVRKHREALERYELTKSVNWSDPASVTEYETKLAEIAKAAQPAESEPAGNEAEITRLQKEIARLQKQSNRPADGDGRSTVDVLKGVGSEEQVGAAIGVKMAKAMNGQL